MARRLTDNEKEIIRELQEQGMSDYEISEKLGIPRGTVRYYRQEVKERKRKYNQRPEVKKRRREYMRRYLREYRRKQKQHDDWEEFLALINGRNASQENSNIYFNILKCLYKYEDCYAIRHRDIAEELKIEEGKKLVHELLKLRKYGFVRYESKRYFLTEKGREIARKKRRRILEKSIKV